MKSGMMYFFVVALLATTVSCSDDDKEQKLKGDPDIQHEGEKWTIESISYNLIDQSVSGTSVTQVNKDGEKSNAGSFYFVEGSDEGSFEITVEGYNKEDRFKYEILDDGSVSIEEISQSVGGTIEQNVVEIEGTTVENGMALAGLITKQSTTGQFVLTVKAMVLVKD
jgi:hypothetical protein